jgi:hypothetical protein
MNQKPKQNIKNIANTLRNKKELHVQMNNIFTKEELARWIEEIKEAAKNDESFSIAWFKPTKNSPLSIIAGWVEYFANESEVDDLFCVSKSQPKYCMCIKIAENEGPYAYTDYEIMNMPYDRITNEVENTEIMLEWDDPADSAAEFFKHEWERLMESFEK